MDENQLYVDSEIESLQSVLLHCPGRELEELTPRFLGELLFDDIPWLEGMQQEHRAFAAALEKQGVEVLYYQSLLEEILSGKGIRHTIVEDLIQLRPIGGSEEKAMLQEYLDSLSSVKLAETLIGGLHRKTVTQHFQHNSLSSLIQGEFNYFLPPLPNLYFTRDPGAVIYDGVSVSSMRTAARKGESLILHYILKHHDRFQSSAASFWFDFNRNYSLEGGDILVLTPRTVLIGCSARSSSSAIEALAKDLIFSAAPVEEVLVMQIPFERAYMHLDTVFTMVDYDAFTIFPGIENQLNLFKISPGQGKSLKIESLPSLEEALKQSLKLTSVRLIRSGGSDDITAAREQWNDGTNTLAVAPGKVVTYNRNQASNEALNKAGIEVIPVEGSELVRGRGGPRCMSMPLKRNPWSQT